MEYDTEYIKSICDDLTFPNTELYSVHYMGGSGGNFLRSLIELYFVKRDFTNKFSAYNNLHAASTYINDNWHPNSFKQINLEFDKPGCPPRHKFIRPIYLDRPVFMYDHTPADFDTIWNRWPQAKVFIITARTEDLYEIKFNKYWKAVVEEFDYRQEGFLDFKKYKPEIFEKYNHPKEVSCEDLKTFLTSTNHTENLKAINFPELKFFDHYSTLPEKFIDKIIKVPYYHLVRNPEYVMLLLSTFLGKPTNDIIREFYYTYIEKQNKLIEDRGPWLREEGQPWNIPLTIE